MLRVFNPEFFSFDVKSNNDTKNNITDILINALVEPKYFDLKQYKKTPFGTFSVALRGHSIYDKIKDNKPEEILEKYFFNATFTQYSRYTDSDFDIILSRFDDPRAHTLIFNDDTRARGQESDPLNKMILLIAMPIKGIVAPVRKSTNFKLYNGVFISCKLFPWHCQYFNKLVYYLVDMTTSFSFQEFVPTGTDIGIMHTYYFSLDMNKEITMQKLTSLVPYNGRENLFSKPEKNLFFLSDIPEDIINRQTSISVPISSE